MPALVVAGHDGAPYPAGHLEAGDHGRHQVCAAPAAPLDGGERGGDDRRPEVTDGGQVDVVIIYGVDDGSVREPREGRGDPFAADQEGRLRRAAHPQDVAADRGDDLRGDRVPRYAAGERVGDELLRPPDHLRRQPRALDARRKLRQATRSAFGPLPRRLGQVVLLPYATIG